MKRCFKCEQHKPTTEFYRNHRMADGLLGKCKDCTKQDVKQRYYSKHEEVCLYERRRAKSLNRKAKVREYQKARRQRHPEKDAARMAVARAVRSGKLAKPTECPLCGSTDRIQAHHDDYSKPLDVTWCCFKCHRTVYHKQLCDETF